MEQQRLPAIRGRQPLPARRPVSKAVERQVEAQGAAVRLRLDQVGRSIGYAMQLTREVSEARRFLADGADNETKADLRYLQEIGAQLLAAEVWNEYGR